MALTGVSSALKGLERTGLTRPVTREGSGDEAVLWQSTSMSIGKSWENESEKSITAAIVVVELYHRIITSAK